MKNRIQIFVFCIILSLLFWGNAIKAQGFSKNSLKLGIGTGISSDLPYGGFGVCYSLGFQREIWEDRLRFNPNISFGHYSLFVSEDGSFFMSLNLEANLFYDVVKTNNFALVLGCGIIGNHSKGSSRIIPSVTTDNEESELYEKYHITNYIGAGFRITPTNSRLAINIMPLNIHNGYDGFFEVHGKIELDIKL